jgi:hypothetical protein
MPKNKKTTKNNTVPEKKSFRFLSVLKENLVSLNSSKFFAGIAMLTMNIASKHVTIDLSKTQESYVKYTLGRQLLIFIVLWMGTRDIITSLILTAVFILLADYLLNENSKYCVLPHQYKELDDVLDTDGDGKISRKEINNAIDILKKAKNKKNGNKEQFTVKNDLHIENYI